MGDNTPIDLQRSLNAFGQRYLLDTPSQGWQTIDDPLTPGMTRGHFQGNHTLGYFTTPQTKNLVIDIDLHDYQQSPVIDHVLQQRYDVIRKGLGKPSFVVRSSESMGIHVYYRLDKPWYYQGIKAVALSLLGQNEGQLKKAKIEFCLTTNHGIAFPFAKARGGLFLNPDTLEELFEIRDHYKAMEHVINAPVCKELDFAIRERYDDLRPSTPHDTEQKYSKLSSEERTQRENIKRQSVFYSGIKEIEAEQGSTDELIYSISRLGYFSKLDIEHVMMTISEKLASGGLIIHADTRDNAIFNRVKSHYKRFKEKNVNVLETSLRKPQLDMITNDIIENIKNEMINRYSLSNRRIKPLIAFLEYLYQWCEYISSMSHNEASLVDWHYKFFYYYTKKKTLVPLPKNLLRKWNGRYHEWMPMFQGIGLLKLERKAYNPYKERSLGLNAKGICNYFRVNWDDFTQSVTT